MDKSYSDTQMEPETSQKINYTPDCVIIDEINDIIKDFKGYGLLTDERYKKYFDSLESVKQGVEDLDECPSLKTIRNILTIASI
jgi:hypothetical protein